MPYETLYSVGLLDDLHNYFPELLYRPQNFSTVQDVLYYIQNQTQTRLNPFSVGLQRYNGENPILNSTVPLPRAVPTTPSPIHVQPHVEVYEPLYDLSPFLSNITSQSHSILRNNRIPQNSLVHEVLNLLSPGAASRFMEPVIVRPTAHQIEAATDLIMAAGYEHTGDDEHDVLCSICQDTYVDGQAIRIISHCTHRFHKSCIDSWFDQNVHCPVCRYDIREDS
jgi:hypothetical protein